jgi:hypothetical protein
MQYCLTVNDCWPTTSWAIVDYFMRPKPAFFAIARELRPFTVGMARKDVKTLDNPSSDAYFKIEQSVRNAMADDYLTHDSPVRTAARDLGEQLVGRGEKGDARGRVFRPGRRQGRRFQVNRGCPCAQRIHRVLQGHRRGTTYQNVGFAIAQDYRRRREVD